MRENQDEAGELRDRNVEATFRDETHAKEAAEAVRRAGVDASVTVDDPEDKRAGLRAEMRDEMESVVIGPGNVGPFTKSMTKGIVLWVPLATVIGAALGLAVAAVFWPSMTGFVVSAIAGAFAGSTAGFVVGGGFKPRADEEGKELDTEAGTTVGVHTDKEAEARRASEILGEKEPHRVDDLGPKGRPLGPTSEEKTRPVRGD